jgi:hypothetical protein
MKKIYKYEIVEDDKLSISLPIGAEILCVQINGKDNKPYIWALVDTTKENEDRYFELYYTGEEIPYDMGIVRKYVGTYQHLGGVIVCHLFERID